MTKRDPLAERARRKFAGKRTVALPADEIRANVLRGPNSEGRWPVNAVDTSPLASALVEATDGVASLDGEV